VSRELELAGDEQEGTHHELLVLWLHLPQGRAAPSRGEARGLVSGHAAGQVGQGLPVRVAEAELEARRLVS
jgi:hypothetical protein